MKHEIHNMQLHLTADEQILFEKGSKEKIKRLGQLLKRYPRPLKLDIHLKKVDDALQVAATLPMLSRVLMCRRKGTDSTALAHEALDCLYKQVQDQIHAERRDFILKKRKRLSNIASTGIEDLKSIHQENDAAHFSYYLQQLLPALKHYISVTAFKIKVVKPLMKQNRIRIVDIIAQVYQYLFDHFAEWNREKESLPIWAIATADKGLQRMAKKYEYRFMKELDFSENGIKAEWERVTFDVDGQANDPEQRSEENFFNPTYYNMAEILQDAGATEAVISAAEEGAFDEKLKQWFYELDLQHTSIFHLYYQLRLTATDIARAKQLPEPTVDNMLNDLGLSLLTYVQEQEG